MRPFLEDNRDKALLIKAKDIQVGDPVLAEVSPLHYVLHRIIQIEDDKVVLRGDSNPWHRDLSPPGRQGISGRILSQGQTDTRQNGWKEMEDTLCHLDTPLPYSPVSAGCLSPHLDTSFRDDVSFFGKSAFSKRIKKGPYPSDESSSYSP